MIVETNRLMQWFTKEWKEGWEKEEEEFTPQDLAMFRDTVGCHIRGVLLSDSG